MACPNCKGVSLTERSSFKTVAEPMEGAAPTTVTVDLMSCESCALSFPSIRGKKKYTLVPPDRLSSLMAELDEARQHNSEMLDSLRLMEKRSKGLAAEIEASRLRNETSELERRIGTLESVNKGLEARRDRLRGAIDFIASATAAGARGEVGVTFQVREPFQQPTSETPDV